MQNKSTVNQQSVYHIIYSTHKKVHLSKQQSKTYSTKDLFMNVHNRCKAR